MELPIEDRESLRKKLSEVSGVNSLFDYLDYASRVVSPTLEDFDRPSWEMFLVYIDKEKDSYQTFEIPKRSGGTRVILSPDPELKMMQRLLLTGLSEMFFPPDFVHGFQKGKSIVNNAMPHIGKRYLLNMDIEDFFPSIHFGRVNSILQLSPFSFPQAVSVAIANLVTYQGCLPQGAPTSPFFSNAVCQRFDRKINRFCTFNKVTYTRYADDMSFSANGGSLDQKFVDRIKRIAIEEGFKINDKKTRLVTPDMRHEVTGLIVNHKLNVSRKYVRNLRSLFNTLEKKGLVAAQDKLNEVYHKEKGSLRYNDHVPALKNVLRGKLEFLKMIKGSDDRVFDRFNTIFQKHFPVDGEKLINEIVTITSEIVSSSQRAEKLPEWETLMNRRRQLGFLEGNLFNKLKKEIYQISKSEVVFLFPSIESGYSNTGDEKKPKERKRKSVTTGEHKPLNTTLFFNKFRGDRTSMLRKLVHPIGENESAATILKSTRTELTKLGQMKIPPKLYKRVMKELIEHLEKASSEWSVNTSNVPTLEELVRKEKDAISRFKKSYQFSSKDEANASDLKGVLVDSIQSAAVEKDKFREKFLLAWFPQNSLGEARTDSFCNIPFETDIPQVTRAFRIIFTMFFENSKGEGGIEIRQYRRGSKVILELIDRKSFSEKKAANEWGGTSIQLAEILNSICDIHYVYDDLEGNTHYYSLTKPDIDFNQVYSRGGFSVILVWHLTPSVLILEDQSDRINEHLQPIQNDFQHQFELRQVFPDYSDIYNYSALLIHSSFKNSQNICDYALQMGVPVLFFGGSILSHSKSHNKYSIPVDEFYQNLPDFLKKIRDNYLIEFDLFFSSDREAQILRSEKNQILLDIHERQLTFPDLDHDIQDRLKRIYFWRKMPIIPNIDVLILMLKKEK